MATERPRLSERPLLFLDVDGVLNCPGCTEGEWVNRGTGYQAYIPKGTTARLDRLTEAYEVVWAIAWNGGAHGPLRVGLGLPQTPWPYVRWAEYKLPALLRYAGPRRWAWIDDDAEFELRALGWTMDMVPGLVVVPDVRVGITDEHVATLLAHAGAAGG